MINFNASHVLILDLHTLGMCIHDFAEKDVLSGGSSVTSSAASWAGWAVGGMSNLTSKLYKKGDKGKTSTGNEHKRQNSHI